MALLTAVLRVPDLRVGDELEVSFTTRVSDPTLGGNDAGMLLLSSDPSPGRYRLGLSWDEGQEPRLNVSPQISNAVTRRPGAVTLSFDNPALLTVPDDAPARYRLQRLVESSDFTDWTTISRHFSPLYGQASKLSATSPVKEEARRIVAAHKGSLDRASEALKLVQQQVCYIHVGLDGGNLMPATADETWRRRYGDCKGKTTLLLALLAEMGIPAEAVLVSNSGADDGLNERLPNPGNFDHVLVRARIDGTDILARWDAAARRRAEHRAGHRLSLGLAAARGRQFDRTN